MDEKKETNFNIFDKLKEISNMVNNINIVENSIEDSISKISYGDIKKMPPCDSTEELVTVEDILHDIVDRLHSIDSRYTIVLARLEKLL